MANNGTLDLSGVEFDIDGNALMNALLPHLITALSTNQALLKQLTATVQTSILQYAKRNGNALGGLAGGNMSGKSTGVNQTSGKSR